MCPRIIEDDVRRPPPVIIRVNGVEVAAYEGESLATALIASGHLIMSRDSSGRPKSPFCNMGICFDCMIGVEDREPARGGTARGDAAGGGKGAGGTVRRVRACLAEVRSGLIVTVAPP